MQTTLPSSTTAEAKSEWDGARESKRRMFLARIGQRDSALASKSWDKFSVSERKTIHGALNEDFISPVWYINTKGRRINFIDIPTIQKSSELLADEDGEQHWQRMQHVDRFNALLACGIGKDAEQGQYALWRNLCPELRTRLGKHLVGMETASKIAVNPQVQMDSRQLALF